MDIDIFSYKAAFKAIGAMTICQKSIVQMNVGLNHLGCPKHYQTIIK
jgi:hypothetical protein